MEKDNPSDNPRDSQVIAAILAGGVKIPPMPGILVECEALNRDEHAGVQEFTRLLAKDAGVAGALFRVAGSPVLGLRAKPDTLDKVISLLGVKSTLAVVRGEALRNALHDPQHGAVMQAMWTRAQAVSDLAVAAHKASRMRGISQDQAMLLGIFHDCGIAILCRRFPGYARDFHTAAPRWPDLVALDKAYQTHHGVVGQMVARNWQLPAELALAIRHHHDTRLEGLPEPVARLIGLMQFAMHLYNRGMGEDDREWESWRPRALAALACNDQALAELEEALLAG